MSFMLKSILKKYKKLIGYSNILTEGFTFCFMEEGFSFEKT